MYLLEEVVDLPNFWQALGNTIWWVLMVIVFVSYLFALFAVVGDLFRDRELSGGWKAVWIIFLVWIPFLTLLVYLIARGAGMAKRAEASAQQSKDATDAYIRSVANSPAEDIAKAKALLDAGTITPDEYAKLKAKALA